MQIRKGEVIDEMDNVDVISIISLSRLIEGGAAMLAAANRNHHIDMVGRNVSMPFIRKRLRV
jgi:hypothetical protein